MRRERERERDNRITLSLHNTAKHSTVENEKKFMRCRTGKKISLNLYNNCIYIMTIISYNRNNILNK